MTIRAKGCQKLGEQNGGWREWRIKHVNHRLAVLWSWLASFCPVSECMYVLCVCVCVCVCVVVAEMVMSHGRVNELNKACVGVLKWCAKCLQCASYCSVLCLRVSALRPQMCTCMCMCMCVCVCVSGFCTIFIFAEQLDIHECRQRHELNELNLFIDIWLSSATSKFEALSKQQQKQREHMMMYRSLKSNEKM